MYSLPLSKLIGLAAIVAVVAVCAGNGLAGPAAPPHAVLVDASGDLQVTNSLDGQAIFQANGLAPGGSVTGTVQLSNTGALAGDLGLAQLDVQDVPGANGGRLSDAVHLDITDVTGGSSVPVFAGQLATVGNRPLGQLGRGRGAQLQVHRVASGQRHPAEPDRRRQRLRRLGAHGDLRLDRDRGGGTPGGDRAAAALAAAGSRRLPS